MNLHIRTLALAALAALSFAFLATSVTAYHYHSLGSYDSFSPSYTLYAPYDSFAYAPRYAPYSYGNPSYYRHPSVYARTHDSLLYASDDFIYYRAEFGAPQHYASYRSMAFAPASSYRYVPSLYEPMY